MADMGIEARFVDPKDPENFQKAVDEKTRAFYGEVLPNPSFEVFPIGEVAAIGKPLGIPLIVDNTLLQLFVVHLTMEQLSSFILLPNTLVDTAHQLGE